MLVVLMLATFGCSSATYIRANAAENPLDRVAQQAQTDWTVERVDANTLQLTNSWPIHSISSPGRSVSRANLSYDGQGKQRGRESLFDPIVSAALGSRLAIQQ
jgi:hypothetical protein